MKFRFQKYDILMRNWLSCTSVLLATLMSSIVVLAEKIPEENTCYFVVTENDSTQVLFPILDKPVINLNQTSVIINSHSKTYSAEMSDIIDFSFVGNFLNEVNTISDHNDGIQYFNNSILIKGLSMGESVSLFDLNGLKNSTYVSENENMVIDLNRIPTGVYILSTKNANYKIKK